MFLSKKPYQLLKEKVSIASGAKFDDSGCVEGGIIMARCPRCGEPMDGGICDNGGFPMWRYKKNYYPTKKVNEKKSKRRRR